MQLEERIALLEKTCSRLLCLQSGEALSATSTQTHALNSQATIQKQIDIQLLEWDTNTKRLHREYTDRLDDHVKLVDSQYKSLEHSVNSLQNEVLNIKQHVHDLHQLRSSSHHSTSSLADVCASSSRLAHLDRCVLELQKKQSMDMNFFNQQIQIKFMEINKKFKREQNYRIEYEDGFKRFISLFQHEFRSIIQLVQQQQSQHFNSIDERINTQINNIKQQMQINSKLTHGNYDQSSLQQLSAQLEDVDKKFKSINLHVKHAQTAIKSANDKADQAKADTTQLKQKTQEIEQQLVKLSSQQHHVISARSKHPTHSRNASSTNSSSPSPSPPAASFSVSATATPSGAPTVTAKPTKPIIKPKPNAIKPKPPTTINQQPNNDTDTQPVSNPTSTSTSSSNSPPTLTSPSSDSTSAAATRIQSVFKGFIARRDTAMATLAPHMPICEFCEKSPSAKRCIECQSNICITCERKIHSELGMQKHKRHYLLNEYKKQSLLARTSKVDHNSSVHAQSTNVSTISVSSTPPLLKQGSGDLLTLSIDQPNPSPSLPVLKGQVLSIACGLNHAGLITSSGRLWLWGSNESGQLGTNDREHHAEPTPIEITGKVKQIACGYEHTLVCTMDGKAYSCGSGMLGKLGHQSDEDVEYLKEITTFPASAFIVHVACGQYNSGFISRSPSDDHSRVFMCGAGESGTIGNGENKPQLTPVQCHFPNNQNIIQLAFGDKHALALTENGQLFAMGTNEFGQLGVHTKSIFQLTPLLVEYFTASRIFLTSIVCGERHSMALSRDGKVYCWGSGESHAIGHMDNVDVSTPVQVTLLNDENIISITAGVSVSYAVSERGDVYGWGWALETPVPKLQENLRGAFIQNVQAGSNECICALTGQAQEIYQYLFEQQEQPVIFEAFKGKRLQDISVGSTHYACVDASGKVFVYGENGDYQLGTGNNIDMDIPVNISLPVSIRRVLCSAYHTVCLSVAGQVYAWGQGQSGRVGHGSDGDCTRPTLLDNIKHIEMKEIAVGQFNSGAISKDGKVYMWGDGAFGQIGIVGFQPQMKPIHVPILDEKHQPIVAVSLSIGNKHAGCVSTRGLAYMWGNNEFGQLGTGATTSATDDDGQAIQHLPAPVLFISNIQLAHVICGEMVTFFQSVDGNSIYSCGSAETNQLCTGESEDQSLPQVIDELRDLHIERVVAGNLNCAAVTQAGQVYVWGWALGEKPTLMEFYQDKPVRMISCGLTDLVCVT